MSSKRVKDLWKKHYSEKLDELRGLGGKIPEEVKNKPENKNSIGRKVIIEQIIRYNWKSHENLSMEQLVEVRATLIEYFRIFKYSYDCECNINPNVIEEYNLEELKIIVEDFEKKVSEKKCNKQIHDTAWEDKIISIPEIKRIEIKQEIKQWVTTDIDKIPFKDLPSLLDTIRSIKKYCKVPTVLDLNDAKLILLNCEIKEYGGTPKKNIDDARIHLKCLETRNIINKKYPKQILPDDCEEVMKIYAEKIVPKNYPQDTQFTQEWVEEELRKLENYGVGLDGLPKSSLV